MADNRTGLSAADIAEQFRDMCGDGSVEWVAGPMQTWLLLDAADMLDKNAKLCELVAKMAHFLRADDEWRDPFYCNPYCADQFSCRSDDCVEVLCPIVEAMRKLGVMCE